MTTIAYSVSISFTCVLLPIVSRLKFYLNAAFMLLIASSSISISCYQYLPVYPSFTLCSCLCAPSCYLLLLYPACLDFWILSFGLCLLDCVCCTLAFSGLPSSLQTLLVFSCFYNWFVILYCCYVPRIAYSVMNVSGGWTEKTQMHAEVKVKKGFNWARQKSESEYRQGSEYQTVKHREDPKPQSARTQARVETGK